MIRQVGLVDILLDQIVEPLLELGLGKGAFLEGHDHPVVHDLGNGLNLFAIGQQRENVIVPFPGLVDALADRDMQDLVAEQHAVQGKLHKNGCLAESGPGI